MMACLGHSCGAERFRPLTQGSQFCFFSHEAVLALKKKGFKAARLDRGLPNWRCTGTELNPITVVEGPEMPPDPGHQLNRSVCQADFT
jgi:hypothetical protein